jgi:acetyl esterase/lipase
MERVTGHTARLVGGMVALAAAVILTGAGLAGAAVTDGKPAQLPVLACTIATDGPDTGLCVVPDPAAADTLPDGYDSGARPSVEAIQYGPDPAQLLDLYLPTTPRPAPVIVYFHPGGWVAGSRAPVTQAILREVPRGYAVASVDYRLAPAVRFPVPLQDAKTAVRWVKAHAHEYHLRADQVIAAGASAGGHLAAMVAVTPGTFEPTGLPPELSAQNSRVAGAVSLVGLLDLGAASREEGTWGPGIVAALLGCPDPTPGTDVTCPEDAMAAASPVNYVSRSAPPLYLGYGDLDTLVPPATNGRLMATRYAELGKAGQAPFDEVQTQGHTIDVDGVNVTRLDAFVDGVRASTGAAARGAAAGRL